MSLSKFIEIEFRANPFLEFEGDILISLLGEKGFDSFVSVQNGIKAYIKSDIFTSESVTECLSKYDFQSNFTWTTQEIVETDWNEVWEKESFKPIVIGNRCIIHSPEYQIDSAYDYEILLRPRMSFGSGYHETTSMIIEELMAQSLKGKTVIDVGTGTGILSIIALKLGCKKAIGIEIDEGAYINAMENAALNNADNFAVIHGDAESLFVYSDIDVLLANINRNIIMTDIDKYAETLKPGGTMLLSGFYTADVNFILDIAKELGLEKVGLRAKNDWALLSLIKIDN